AEFSPDGATLATGSADRTARLWDAHTGNPLLVFAGPQKDVSCVAFSPDGSRLAASSSDGSVRTWDTRTGNPLLELKGDEFYAVHAVAFSPAGGRLAADTRDGVKLRDALTGDELLELKGPTGPVTGLCFSPDGALLATVSQDRTARVWDARGGQPVR